MRKKGFLILCFFCLMFCSSSYAAKQKEAALPGHKQEVLPQHKEEVSAIYRECLREKHGVMMQCIQERVRELGEDVDILVDVDTAKEVSDWQAPDEYAQRANNSPADEESLRRAEEVYKFYCATCHGIDGRGRGPDVNFNRRVADLTSPKLLQKTDGALFWKITEGGWPMPAFWEGDVLSEADLWALIHYVRSLSGKEEQGN